MLLRCYLAGHRSRALHWNAGLAFGRCDHCGAAVIHGGTGHWVMVPQGYHIVWKPEGEHALRPRAALQLAARDAPFLHRVRRRNRSRWSYHLD